MRITDSESTDLNQHLQIVPTTQWYPHICQLNPGQIHILGSKDSPASSDKYRTSKKNMQNSSTPDSLRCRNPEIFLTFHQSSRRPYPVESISSGLHGRQWRPAGANVPDLFQNLLPSSVDPTPQDPPTQTLSGHCLLMKIMLFTSDRHVHVFPQLPPPPNRICKGRTVHWTPCPPVLLRSATFVHY